MRSRQTNRTNFRLSIALFGMGVTFTIIFCLIEVYVFLFVTFIMMLEFIFLMFYYYALKHLDNQKRIKYLQWSQYLTYAFSLVMAGVLIANIGIALIVTIQLFQDRTISIPITHTLISRVGPSYYLFFIFNVAFAAFNIHSLKSKREQAKKFIFQILNPSFISAATDSISYDSNQVHSKSKVEEICAVCLENYTSNHHQIILPCQHKFHEECIKEVLTFKRCCPLCRALA